MVSRGRVGLFKSGSFLRARPLLVVVVAAYVDKKRQPILGKIKKHPITVTKIKGIVFRQFLNDLLNREERLSLIRIRSADPP